MSPNGYDRFMWRRFNQFSHRFFPNQSFAKDLNARGVDLASQGSFQDALAVFEAALDANPNYPEVWANLGSCRAGIGDLLGACDAYSESLFQDVHQAPVLDNWANALARLGKLTAAVDKHQQAIEIDQSLIHAKANLGSTLWAMGRVDEGVTLMERAWASNPSDQ
jgi:tetratricopeptide (TPR) repeat protein